MRFPSVLSKPSRNTTSISTVLLSMQRDDSGWRGHESYGFRFTKTVARNVQDAVAVSLESFERIKRKIGARNSICEFRCAGLNSAAVRRDNSSGTVAFLRPHPKV